MHRSFAPTSTLPPLYLACANGPLRSVELCLDYIPTEQRGIPLLQGALYVASKNEKDDAIHFLVMHIINITMLYSVYNSSIRWSHRCGAHNLKLVLISRRTYVETAPIMSDSNDEFVTIVGKSRTPKVHGTVYQIRMEVMLSSESGRINMARILTKVVKRANSGITTVRFLDVNKVPFTAVTVPIGKEFVERLAVATVESGRTRKMVMGFYMESKLLMSDIKSAININWLAQQKIFLRPHRLPFAHGTDLFLIGYITQEHPTTVNFDQLKAMISKKWYNPDQPVDITMQDDENEDEDDADEQRTDYNDLIAALITKGSIQNQALQIPITTEQSYLKVTSPGKPAFEVNILSVYVPRKHKEAATLLNDFSINANNDLSLVPFSLSKTNSEQFYHQM
jgi:hypothetical protein